MANVLILDDDPETLLALKLGLQELGHKVLAFGDGNITRWIFEKQPIDVVITDILMPQFDGLQVIGDVTKNHPDIRVCAISGGGFKDAKSYLNMAKALGAEKVFEKPVKLEELQLFITKRDQSS